MAKAKHIATYALYSFTGKRVGTGFLYTQQEIVELRRQLWEAGLPFHMRWRNDACRIASSKPLTNPERGEGKP